MGYTKNHHKIPFLLKKKSLFYSRRFAMPQSGQFLHYRSNSLYYNEKVKHVNLQVQTFQAKKIMSISLFPRELLQLKNHHKKSGCQFIIYVCAYYFLTNKDI